MGCTLFYGPPGALDLHRFVLPPGTSPVSTGALSADDTLVAFQLQRSRGDPLYDPGHPGAPSDVAVVDLRSGGLTVLPGVELAPKSSVGLTFSTDSRWLLIALNGGSRTRLLVWRPGMIRPQRSPAPLLGPVLYQTPVLDAQS